MPVLTAEEFNDWQRYFDQAPWGPERDDWRRMALEARRSDPDTEAKLAWPYFPDPEADSDAAQELETRAATLSQAELDAKFAKAREEHYRKNPKRG